jgi:hypothetical protein
MIHFTRRPAGCRLTQALALAAATILTGCGQPGEGSVKVAPGVRARLGTGPPGIGPAPKPSAPAGKTAKGKAPMPEVFGIKSRMSKEVPTP